jgi:hypothetical protein
MTLFLIFEQLDSTRYLNICSKRRSDIYQSKLFKLFKRQKLEVTHQKMMIGIESAQGKI